MTDAEKHELNCLRARVLQLSYPCSPHCDGYLRELATRNTAGFLSDPDDAWAERYCTYVGWSPDGQNVSFNSDGPSAITFREMAKNHIRAAQQAWLSTRAETAPPADHSAAILGNVRAEIREEVACALELANADTTERTDRTREEISLLNPLLAKGTGG